MKIHFWSVGKPHEAYVKAGIEDFTKRISNYYPVEWKIFSPSKQTANASEAGIKTAEAHSVISALQKDDYLVLLDETGKQLASPELATFIETRAGNSVRTLIFFIGGAYGVDGQLKARANFVWSLSKLVFPHQLVRLILSEQVYRACTIIRNQKYHHQ